MQTLPTVATTAHPAMPRTGTVLDHRLTSELLAPARRAGYELDVIGTSEEPRGEVPWRAPDGHWWTFRHHLSDPTAEQYGGVVVPEEVREKLVHLLREGFAPDLVWIGHEMPRGWGPGAPVPDLVPTRAATLPVPTAPALPPARLPEGSGDAALAVGRVVLKAGTALLTGAAKAGAAIGAALSDLDPIIVAGVRDPRTGAVTWVEVARWAW